MIFNFYYDEVKGVCIVTSLNIEKGTTIGTYLLKEGRLIKDCIELVDGWIETYPLGRYLNHSTNPNLEFNYLKDSVELVANRHIKANEELTVDYSEIKKALKIPNKILSYDSILSFKDRTIVIQDKSMI